MFAFYQSSHGILSLSFCQVNAIVGCDEPVSKNKKIYFPSTEVYHKNCTETITLTEQFEY